MQSVSRATAVATLGNNQRDIAEGLVNSVFGSIRRLNVQDGIVQDYSTPDEWRHRTAQDIEFDIAYLEIHRPSILNALSDYLADDSLQNREVDWLFLNLLTYSEYLATVTEIRKKVLGIDAYIKSLDSPKNIHDPSISALASRPVRTFFALSATAMSLLIHPTLAIGVGALSLYWYSKQKKDVEKIDTLLSAMLRTYSSFNTVDLSWSHVGRSLEQSRLEGAVWDASLYKLAEARQSAT